jgi:hypothetical protein
MAVIVYKPRYGRDLIEYSRRQLLDPTLATNWAIETFVMVNDEPLDIVAISKLTNKAYLMISSKIFCQNDAGISDNNNVITYGDWVIHESEIDKNLITYLQTSNKTDSIDLMIKLILKIYNIDLPYLETLPYNLVSYMMQKLNNFLSQLTEPRDSFDIEDCDLFRDS